MLSFDICYRQFLQILNPIRTKQNKTRKKRKENGNDLVEADGVEHEAEVHSGDGHIGDDGEPEKLPERNMLGRRIAGGIGDQAHHRRDGEVEAS